MVTPRIRYVLTALCLLATLNNSATHAVANTFTTLHNFSPGVLPSYPNGPVTEGNDGNFYGTSETGGTNNYGTIFKITPSGVQTTIYSFSYPDGENPTGNLAIDKQTGNFYGVTANGGANGYGTVFMITPGGALTTLHSFDKTDGGYPQFGLVRNDSATDTNFYGVTTYDGANGYGEIYSVNPSGTFKVRYSFTSGDGTHPECVMAPTSGGALYGTLTEGGSHGDGLVFKFTPPSTFVPVASFDNTTGLDPEGTLIKGTDGNYYGTTVYGGTYGDGDVFRVTPSGDITVVHSFEVSDGDYPENGVIQDGDVLYGAVADGGANNYGDVFAVDMSGSSFHVLHNFGNSDAWFPRSPLIVATNGLLYGTTTSGMANMGVVYSVSTSGAYKTVIAFSDTDGSEPYSPVIRGSDGYFYGTTYDGGSSGNGCIYKMTPAGAMTILHSFDYYDGSEPEGGLVQGVDGYLYGTTYWGGNDAQGVIFKISKSGNYSVLHYFQMADGIRPLGALLQASDNNFYGTTLQGGANNADGGTVFRMTPAGVYTVLHTFVYAATSAGYQSEAGLMEGKNGLLYGTTEFGGNDKAISYGYGTVFEVSKTGSTFSTIHEFAGKDGEYPRGSLAEAPNSNYYGTTVSGGANGDGVIYEITPAGKFSVATSFDYSTTGEGPNGPLTWDASGNLFGTAYGGGANDRGTLFELSASGTLSVQHAFDGTDGGYPYGGLTQTSADVFYGTSSSDGTQDAGTVYKLVVSPSVEAGE